MQQEMIGKITNIKLGTLLAGSPTETDFCAITVKETSSGKLFVFHLWSVRIADLPEHRVEQSQRLAVAREAAFRKLTVHLFHDSTASLVDQIQIDTP